MGAPADEWNEAAARLKGKTPLERRQSPDFVTLYRLAAEHGARKLVGSKIDAQRARDVVLDLVLTKLDALVEAEDPFPFFLAAVKNAGRDWVRRKSSYVAADLRVERAQAEPLASEGAAELEVVLKHLNPLERRVFALEAVGEDHTNIGLAIGKKRDAVAQIISRARKKLRERGVL